MIDYYQKTININFLRDFDLPISYFEGLMSRNVPKKSFLLFLKPYITKITKLVENPYSRFCRVALALQTGKINLNFYLRMKDKRHLKVKGFDDFDCKL